MKKEQWYSNQITSRVIRTATGITFNEEWKEGGEGTGWEGRGGGLMFYCQSSVDGAWWLRLPRTLTNLRCCFFLETFEDDF